MRDMTDPVLPPYLSISDCPEAPTRLTDMRSDSLTSI